MKRSSIVFLSLVLAIVLCVPSVPAYADTISIPGYYTQESIAGIFTGDFDSNVNRSNIADRIYNASNGDVNMDVLHALSEIDTSDYVNGYSSFVFYSQGSYFIFFYGLLESEIGNDSYLPLLMLKSSGHQYYISSLATAVNYNRYLQYYVYNSGGLSQRMDLRLDRFDDGTRQFNSYQIPPSTLTMDCAFIYGYNLGGVYSINEYLSYNNTSYNPIYSEAYFHEQILNNVSFTNYWSSSLPYYDGSSIIDPDAPVGESNTNHLYLSNCDSGFTKPLSLNNLNSSGGGYVYFTYNFDDWINSHSGDYTLQCNSTFYINNSSTGAIVRKNLDISGVAIYSLAELGDFVDWQNLNTTFMGYPNQILTGNYIKGYVYSLTYTQFGILQERYAKAGAHTVSYWLVKFANMLPGVKVTENNVNYESYFNTVVPSRFDLKVSFKIIDNVSGEESGTYTKTFNMLTGISNVDSNSIQDNNNPYVPTNSDDLQLPSIDDNGNGYLIKTGDNNQIVNLTTPDNIKLFIDNGFQQFLTWYETSADTAYASNRFWSSMGIFEDNPATELYSEYFGFLPDDFKTLIFSCAGIGIVGGAYCILRRRLH